MAKSDGDPFEDGDLLSYEEMNRILTNFRGTTIPSNLQPGALYSRSADDRLSHKTDADEYLIFQGNPVCADNTVVCTNNSVVVTLPV